MNAQILFPNLSYEFELWQRGVTHIAGLDEAGRGAWAGPVAAGAVVLPEDASLRELLKGVRDSKLMTPHQRERWVLSIQSIALAWGVGFASAGEIDRIGIVPATRLAMQRAVELLWLSPGHLLVDALRLPDLPHPQTAIIKGDRQVLSIAAASILAKVARDGLMQKLDRQYPAYGFARHKGYGTAFHQQALSTHGPCEIHRCSYAPVKAALPGG